MNKVSQEVSVKGDNNNVCTSQVALMMKAINVNIFVGEARQVAVERSRQCAHDLLKQLSAEGMEHVLSEPRYWQDIHEGISAYMIEDNTEKREVVLEMLMEGAIKQGSEMEKILVSDAIPKLTSITIEQYSALALIYAIRQKSGKDINSLEELRGYLTSLDIFNKNINHKSKDGDGMHLDSINCVSIKISHDNIHEIISKRYQGVIVPLFSREWAEKAWDNKDINSILKEWDDGWLKHAELTPVGGKIGEIYFNYVIQKSNE